MKWSCGQRTEECSFRFWGVACALEQAQWTQKLTGCFGYQHPTASAAEDGDGDLSVAPWGLLVEVKEHGWKHGISKEPGARNRKRKGEQGWQLELNQAALRCLPGGHFSKSMKYAAQVCPDLLPGFPKTMVITQRAKPVHLQGRSEMPAPFLFLPSTRSEAAGLRDQ